MYISIFQIISCPIKYDILLTQDINLIITELTQSRVMIGQSINTSVLSSYIYALCICVSSGGLGSWLVVICRDSLSMDLDTIGLVRSTCFISGVVMVVFVASWLVFMAMSVSSSSNVQKKKESAVVPLEFLGTKSDFYFNQDENMFNLPAELEDQDFPI